MRNHLKPKTKPMLIMSKEFSNYSYNNTGVYHTEIVLRGKDLSLFSFIE